MQISEILCQIQKNALQYLPNDLILLRAREEDRIRTTCVPVKLHRLQGIKSSPSQYNRIIPALSRTQ